MTATLTATENFEIIWADKEYWNGPIAVSIRVRLVAAGTGDDARYADYRRDANGNWFVLTWPMNYKDSERPWEYRLGNGTMPVDTEVWHDLDGITAGLLGPAGAIAPRT